MRKAEIRKYYLEKRKDLSSEQIKQKSADLANQFFSKVNLEDVEYLHVFIPIAKFNEVDTWLIIHKIWQDYPDIKVVTSVTLENELQHFVIDKQTQFIEDKWGIPTPKSIEEISADKIDLVITPLLAFDRNNNRVGYGKGYYDKFFADCKPNVGKVGLSLFPPLEDEIEDVNEFDIALDEVLFYH